MTEEHTEVLARPLRGFPGFYASSSGDVICARKTRGRKHQLFIMASYIGTTGYPCVRIQTNKKRIGKKIHRLVVASFYGPSDMVIRHLDGDRTNNHISNLSYGTMKENAEDREKHGRQLRGEGHQTAKLTESDVLEIRHLRSLGIGPCELGRRYGVTNSNICAITARKSWTHLGG